MVLLLNATQAAKVIGCDAQRVRERMKRGLWDIGDVVLLEGNTTKTYEVYAPKLAKFLGLSMEELRSRLQEAENESEK